VLVPLDCGSDNLGMIKWLPDVGPADRAVDVAARSLRSRLEAVRAYFRRSVKDPDEPENFHQLRVWTRRSESALSLYADLLPPRRLKRIQKTLRQIRRTAGRVRDCDVFAKRVVGAGEEWPAELRKERKRAHKKLVGLYLRLGRDKQLRRQVENLIDRLRSRNADRTERFADRARSALWPLVNAFFDASPVDASNAAALHKFRLAGKDLRYAMESLAPAFAPPFREDLYPTLASLQEKLGVLNDLASTKERLREQIDETGDPARLSDLRRRLAATGEELVRAGEEFEKNWNPPIRDALRARFAELCGAPG
jgi:CHAD domain-containing protein